MTSRHIAAFVLVDFLALNAMALYFSGLGGVLSFLSTMGWWGAVLVADLLIALTMVVLWMWRDARASGRHVAGFAALSYLTGSIGPLLYLATRRDGATL